MYHPVTDIKKKRDFLSFSFSHLQRLPCYLAGPIEKMLYRAPGTSHKGPDLLWTHLHTLT